MGTKGQQLVVVSNRLPLLEAPSTDEERREAPVGGLVSALQSSLEQRGGTWVGWSGHVTERAPSGDPRVSAIGQVRLVGLDLPRAEFNLFYNVFCNRTLWPLLHSFPAKMTVRLDAYRAYRRVNRRFAEAVLRVANENDLVWVNDFHLFPIAKELRRLGWTGRIGFFLHTPFPPAEVFALLPWAEDLLEAFLDYDLFGLQTRRYERNLNDSMSTELGGGLIGDVFTNTNKSLRVKTYPIGIDPDEINRMASQAENLPGGSFLRQVSPELKIVLGVDRLDYTKGIGLRLRAFQQLLEHYPGLRGKVSMVQISAPSRSHVPEYIEERQQVDQLVGRINGRFSEGGWVPVHYLYRSYPQSELVAFYREANVGLVTPVRDGMNLVAKEFVAAQGDDPGVVVLSKFCGAVATMPEALIVNPYDLEETARAIYRGLRMPRRERVSRWSALIEGIRSYTAQDWSDEYLSDLAGSELHMAGGAFAAPQRAASA